METTQKKAASFKGIRSAGWVIVICFIIAVLIFHFVLGNPSNFIYFPADSGDDDLFL